MNASDRAFAPLEALRQFWPYANCDRWTQKVLVFLDLETPMSIRILEPFQEVTANHLTWAHALVCPI